MPRLQLKAHRVYQTAIKLIESGGNQTEAYLAAHPAASRASACSSASKFISKNNIVEIAQQIAQEQELTSLDYCVRSLSKQVEAQKYQVLGNEIREVPDHGSQLAAKKFLLQHVYGVNASKQNDLENKSELRVCLSQSKQQAFLNAVAELKTLLAATNLTTTLQPTPVQEVTDVSVDKPIDTSDCGSSSCEK